MMIRMTRRNLLKAALAPPTGSWLARYRALVEPMRRKIKEQTSRFRPACSRIIELLQRLHARQMRFPDSAFDRVPFPLFRFGKQQYASKDPMWFFFSRMACSASVPNCEAIIGIRKVLQWALMVASCNYAIWLLIAPLPR
jgi:hypothetical protein